MQNIMNDFLLWSNVTLPGFVSQTSLYEESAVRHAVCFALDFIQILKYRLSPQGSFDIKT